MIIIFFLTSLFLFSCSSESDDSFSSLSQSFQNWYYKNNPVLSTQKDYDNYDAFFRGNDFKANERYILDLKRFYFELTQIDYKKLNKENKIDYDSIKKTILKEIYVNDNLKEAEWRPSVKLLEVYNGLQYLIHYESNSNSDLIKRLKLVDKALNQSLVNLSHLSDDEYDKCSDIIKKTISLLSTFLSASSKDDDVGILVDSVKESFINYQSDLLSIKEQFKNKMTFTSNDDKHFKVITESDKSIRQVYVSAKEMLKSQHLQLFDNSLDLFLQNNDEPVWLDYEDTLTIISKVIENIEKDYKVDDFRYIEESIDRYASASILTRISFYSDLYDMMFLEEDLDILMSLSSPNKRIQLNLPKDKISSVYKLNGNARNLNKIQLDLLTAYKIYPGYAYIFKNKINSSNLTYLIPNYTTLRGLQRYSERILIKTNRLAGIKHQIIHDKNLTRDICASIIDIEYNNGQISRNDMKKYFMEMCFLNEFEADKLTGKIVSNYFGYASINFIGYYRILELEKLYLDKADSEYIKFYNKILENGIADLENLSIPFE